MHRAISDCRLCFRAARDIAPERPRRPDPDSPSSTLRGQVRTLPLRRPHDAAGSDPGRASSAPWPFSEGLAAVRIDGRFGFIDRRGEVVIEPRFDLAGEFHQGLAEILVGRNTGVIDRTGRVVVLPQFRRAVPLTKDVIIADRGRVAGTALRRLREARQPRRGSAAQFGNAGLYHISGRWIRRPGPRPPTASRCSRPTAAAWSGRRVRGDKFDLVGLLSSDGNWVVEPQYEYAGQLLEDRAIVRKRVDGVTLAGAVDPNGPARGAAAALVPGLLERRPGPGRTTGTGTGKQALMDKSGNIVGGHWFDKVIARAEEGDIAIVQIGDRQVGLDRAGNIVANPRNGRVVRKLPERRSRGRSRRPLADHRCQPDSRPRRICSIAVISKLDLRPAVSGQARRASGASSAPTADCCSIRRSSTTSKASISGYRRGQGRREMGHHRRIWPLHCVEPKFDEIMPRPRRTVSTSDQDGRKIWIDRHTATSSRSRGSGTLRPSGVRSIAAMACGLWSARAAGASTDGDKELIAPRYRALNCFGSGMAWASDRQPGASGVRSVPMARCASRPACKTVHYQLVD